MAFDHQAYFEDQLARSVPEFWRRMGGRPACEGKRVLDLGSGHGAMSLELAQHGASVLGLDLNPELVEWAKTHVEPTEVLGNLEFRCEDVRSLPTGGFDYIVSKDTFEHIQGVGSMLVTLRDRLASGGRILIGFSPLFYSPKGDHGVGRFKVPWTHAVSRRSLYDAASRERGEPVRSLAELGLNGMTPAEFRSYVGESGLRFETLRYNVSDRPAMTVMNVLRRIPPLERYATISIYAVVTPVGSRNGDRGDAVGNLV